MKNAEKLISKIKKEDIRQNSFLLLKIKNFIFWLLFLFSILVGSISFSIILFFITEEEFSIYNNIISSGLELFLLLLPIFWLFLFLVIFIVSIFVIKKTKYGYRKSFLFFSFSFLFSLILGFVLSKTDIGKEIEHIFSEKIPVYKGFDRKKDMFWSRPKKGFLSGIVVSVKPLIINDEKNNHWEIDIKNKHFPKKIKIGHKVKISGKKLNDNTFIADKIMPWHKDKKFFKKFFERN